MTTTPATPRRGHVPHHVAWVAGEQMERTVASPERHGRALSALVETALDLGVRWLTVQEPSCGASLRVPGRAADLAGRGVAVAEMPEASQVPPSLAYLVEVEAPSLRVVCARPRSGRSELVAAVREIARRGVEPKGVNEAEIGRTFEIPDVDLLVRTTGDRRVPDLLVWQVAYSEIVVLDDPWPDVAEAQFAAAVSEYQRRNRRYGGLVTSR